MILCESSGVHIVASTWGGFKLGSKFKDEVTDNGINYFQFFQNIFLFYQSKELIKVLKSFIV
jgi:hypothetical protein